MTSERKAFKVVFNLISEDVITEKEAFALMEGIFAQNIIQIPTPVPYIPETENSTEDTPKQIEVTGFLPAK